MTRLFAAALVGLGAAGAVAAQAAPAAPAAGRFQVTPMIGVMRYDRTTALSSTESGLSTKLYPTAGLLAAYTLRPNIQVGAYLEAARPETDPQYYPYALIQTTGSIQLFEITQRVVVLSYGLAATVTLPVAPRLGPYLRAGVGLHTVFPDVQRAQSTETISGSELMLGAGFKYAVSDAVGIRLELTDFMWNNWDRDDLNPVAPAFQNTIFPEDNPSGISWPKPGLVHNMRFALGFTFTPTGAAR